MSNRLAVGDLAHAVSAHESYSKIAERITERMNYIVRFCVDKAGGRFDWWDWSNGGDGDDRAPGDLIHSIDKFRPAVLSIEGSWTVKSMQFINKDGDVCDLNCREYPTRWLSEDFEQEFTDGLQLYQDRLAKKTQQNKANSVNKKQQKEALLASAKAKLTPEERKVLGLK